MNRRSLILLSSIISFALISGPRAQTSDQQLALSISDVIEFLPLAKKDQFYVRVSQATGTSRIVLWTEIETSSFGPIFR
jgi:hypothetical protein